jgi:hypothetical protein
VEPLMSDDKHTLRRMLLVLHRCLVRTRNLALSQDCQAVYELSDTFEIIPLLMESGSRDDLARIREILADYQSRHPESIDDYLGMLDMTDAEAEARLGLSPNAALDRNWMPSEE